MKHFAFFSSCPVRVRCEDGTCYSAEHVLVTVSVGVLKASHHTLFQPPLPRNKLHAIDTIKFGQWPEYAINQH